KVPQANGVIGAGAGERVAVGRKEQGADGAGVLDVFRVLGHVAEFAGLRVPNINNKHSVFAERVSCGEDVTSVRRERKRVIVGKRAKDVRGLRQQKLCAAFQRPKNDAVARTRGELYAVWRKSQRAGRFADRADRLPIGRSPDRDAFAGNARDAGTVASQSHSAFAEAVERGAGAAAARARSPARTETE